MRKLYTVLFLTLLCGSGKTQSFYYESFTAGTFPSGWTPSDSRIALSNASQSSGYSSSSTSPPASGGNNARFNHCTPTGETVTLTESGLVNTIGKTNIRVGFGLRTSPAWNSHPVVFEWSSDGTNWEMIDGNVSVYAPGGSEWGSTYFDLPAGAENVSNLRFRFSFVTSTTDNCTAPPNFRIDDFIVGFGNSLPIELLDLTARLVDKKASLHWSTASETGNAHFAIERSPDGRAFTEIGRVAGAGTTREKQDYTFTDERPLPGINYYRLRQVDLDGAFSFSPVRRVIFGRDGGPALLFPSPAGDQLTVQWAEPTDTDMAWEIADAAGRQVIAGIFPAETTEISIGVEQLQPGAYLLRLISGQMAFSKIFIKR